MTAQARILFLSVLLYPLSAHSLATIDNYQQGDIAASADSVFADINKPETLKEQNHFLQIVDLLFTNHQPSLQKLRKAYGKMLKIQLNTENRRVVAFRYKVLSNQNRQISSSSGDRLLRLAKFWKSAGSSRNAFEKAQYFFLANCALEMSYRAPQKEIIKTSKILLLQSELLQVAKPGYEKETLIDIIDRYPKSPEAKVALSKLQGLLQTENRPARGVGGLDSDDQALLKRL